MVLTDAQKVAAVDKRLNGHGRVILSEAASAKLSPSLACAIVEQESQGFNVFGHDYPNMTADAPPYYGHPVTHPRVLKLIKSPYMNGVGLTQLTWWEFVERAEKMGGAHLPVYQCRVGFTDLVGMIRQYGYEGGLGAYNAGADNRGSVLHTYVAQVAAKHDRWKVLLGENAPAPDHSGNFQRGVRYFEPAVGRAEYWYWPPSLDIVPDGPGAFAVNKPMPPVSEVIHGGIFCQGVINGFRRVNRKRVPIIDDERYDGGTWANQNFFKDFIEPFDYYAVYEPGCLIGRYFRWAGAPGFSDVLDQGHVSVLVTEHNLSKQKAGIILHSHPGVGGLARTRLGDSHAGWYYEYVVRPYDWINHGKGGF